MDKDESINDILNRIINEPSKSKRKEKSVYESWDESDLDGVMANWRERYTITFSGEFGCDSMRDKFKVVCKDCDDLELHPSTTYPNAYVEPHEKEVHSKESK